MGSPFSTERLVEPDLSVRLSALLDEAARELQLESVALLELAAEQGTLAPVWRCWFPAHRAPPAAPTLEQFSTVASRAASGGGATEEASEIGPLLVSAPWSQAVALRVSPQVHGGPDTLLVLSASRAPGSTLLSQLVACLESGLSHDRRRRLANVLFQAVEHAADAMELTDSKARLLYANRAWQDAFGYSLADVRGQTVGNLFRDRTQPLHDAAFYQFTLATLADGGPWVGALACRTRDGQRRFCEVAVSPYAADAEGFRGNFAVRRDLSHRVERDHALANAHREFRAVLASIPDGVAVLRDDQIYFANQALLDTVELTEEELIGRAYADLVHPEDRDRFNDEFEHRVTRVRVVRADGAPRFLEISSAGAVSFEGRPATILLSRDTTDYRVAQEQLSRAEKLSALGSLAAGVAHEINNPLAYVLLNTEFVKQAGGLDESRTEAIGEAVDGIRRIQQIVAELKGYSSSDEPGAPEPVDVKEATTSAVNIAQNEIRHRARLERDHEEGLHVVAREGPLVQVLVNVLVNAAQAIPGTDGHSDVITIASERLDDDTVAIRISDTGTGIPEATLPHVFDPFSTGKSRGEGCGLGLAISKRIIEDFGGRIAISSTLGQGTTVSIELPSVPAPRAVAPTPRPSNHRLRAASSTRILVVDDEVAVSRSIKRVLSGHDVTIARGAQEALHFLDTRPPFELVLCDLMMPGVTGAELYREACRRHPSLADRFVFMTGGVFADWAREFVDGINCPVLSKPLDLSSVLTLVDAQRGMKSVG